VLLEVTAPETSTCSVDKASSRSIRAVRVEINASLSNSCTCAVTAVVTADTCATTSTAASNTLYIFRMDSMSRRGFETFSPWVGFPVRIQSLPLCFLLPAMCQLSSSLLPFVILEIGLESEFSQTSKSKKSELLHAII